MPTLEENKKKLQQKQKVANEFHDKGNKLDNYFGPIKWITLVAVIVGVIVFMTGLTGLGGTVCSIGGVILAIGGVGCIALIVLKIMISQADGKEEAVRREIEKIEAEVERQKQELER